MKTFDEAVDEVIGKRLTRDIGQSLISAADLNTHYGLSHTCKNITVRNALTKILIWVEQEPEQAGPALATVFALGMAVGMEMEKGETLSEKMLEEK